MEKNKDPEAFRRSSALNDFLKELHNLFLMFHGPVRALLDKDPIGVLARNHLYPFIADYLTGTTTFLTCIFFYFYFVESTWMHLSSSACMYASLVIAHI